MAPLGLKARNSSALALSESFHLPLRCPLIAVSHWSVDLTIMGESVRRGRSHNGPGSGVQEQKLVGIGEARKLTSSVPPVSDATLMGNEDRGRVGGAADSQGGGNLYPSLTGTPPPD